MTRMKTEQKNEPPPKYELAAQKKIQMASIHI